MMGTDVVYNGCDDIFQVDDVEPGDHMNEQYDPNKIVQNVPRKIEFSYPVEHSSVPDGLFPMDEEQDKARKASTPPQDKSVVFGQSEEDAEDLFCKMDTSGYKSKKLDQKIALSFPFGTGLIFEKVFSTILMGRNYLSKVVYQLNLPELGLDKGLAWDTMLLSSKNYRQVPEDKVTTEVRKLVMDYGRSLPVTIPERSWLCNNSGKQDIVISVSSEEEVDPPRDASEKRQRELFRQFRAQARSIQPADDPEKIFGVPAPYRRRYRTAAERNIEPMPLPFSNNASLLIAGSNTLYHRTPT
ncbi:unnamed protein product [Enterobius vermicularis]|uniref:Uncharacterized protein n=1 Tax=Enterobius vermicularis TaxID=51028 RepID=A0A0N4VK32_ENTVE|nr:unnamed protein product [Enterobius vermicularis]